MKNVRLLVPILTLIACAIGWTIARTKDRPFAPIASAAAPTTTLEPMTFNSRQSTLEGRVVTTDGDGVPEALVWLRSDFEPQWAYTDEEGRFRVDALEEGPWTACVLAREFLPQRSTIAAGTLTTTITLDKPVGPPPALPPIVRSELHGRIRDARDGDLAGYEVVLTPLQAPQTLGAPVPRRVQADSHGEFAIEDLAEGEYGVQVFPPWARGGSWPDLLQALGAREMQPYVHLREFAPVLNVALKSGAVRGTLTNAQAEAVEGGLVLLSAGGDAGRLWPPISTDARGSFSIDDLPPGTYEISARAGAASARQTLQLGAGEVRACDLRL